MSDLNTYILVISDQRKIKEEFREKSADWFRRMFNQEPNSIMGKDTSLDNRGNALVLRGPMQVIRGVRIRETRPTMIVLDIPDHRRYFVGDLAHTPEGGRYTNWFLNEVYPMIGYINPSVPVVNLQKFDILPSRKETNA